MRRSVAYALIALSVLALAAQTLTRSSERLYPKWDEVHYLALARDYAREGGLVATVKCHLEGRCTHDNRHPLYNLALQAVVDDEPQSFADARLVTFATTALLLLIVFFMSRRLWGLEVATGVMVLLGASPSLADFSAGLVHDILFCALAFLAVFAIAEGLEKRARWWADKGALWWLGVGGVIGLAYLTKGSGHLLLGTAVLVSVHRYRLGIVKRPILYLAIAGFTVVASWYLWRNYSVYGNPLHNFNNRTVWLDRWRDAWTLYRSPEWNEIGVGWYFQHHSIFDFAWRLIQGFFVTFALFVYTAGVGLTWMGARAATGLVIVVLGIWGLVRRWRAGHRWEVGTVLYATTLFTAALSFGFHYIAERYVFPMVLLFFPYAVMALRERVLPWLRRWLRPAWMPVGLVAASLVALVAWFGGGLTQNPRKMFKVDADWHEASVWLSRNLRPGETFALPYHSYYSTWDAPRPDTDPRWSYDYRNEPGLMLEQMRVHKIRKVLVDLRDVDYPKYTAKLSAERDAHGPQAFLGWPRCFADGGRPSRFLIYCAPVEAPAPAVRPGP